MPRGELSAPDQPGTAAARELFPSSSRLAAAPAVCGSKRLPRYACFPFGGGPWRCLGTAFAMLEAALVLATMAQRFRLRLRPGHPVTLQPAITLRPQHGITMVLHRR